VFRQSSVVVPLLVVVVPIIVFSQSRRGVGTSTAPAKLEIQLAVGNSRPLRNLPAYVEISSLGGGLALRGYTDFDGRINFDVPSGARYQASISGPGIKSRSTTFDLPPTERFHREEIEVELRRGGTVTSAPGGMVSAPDLRVPKKAGQEFAKGMKEMIAHNWSKARQHLEKAIKYYPQFDWAYNNLGVACIQEKDAKDAREAFEKAVRINEKNIEAVKNLARLKLADNDFAGAKAVLVKPGQELRDPEALTMLSYTQLRTREFDAALANALKVPHGGTDSFPVVHLIAARVYEIKGDRSAAEAQYKEYLKVAPDGPQAGVAKEGLQRVEPHGTASVQNP